MAAPSEKLAQSLKFLKTFQDQGVIAIRSNNMTRTHRERLQKHGFIREVMKGWYIPSSPNETGGESTAWYASFWGFCGEYLESRFGEDWCLGPEQSISLHTGNWTVPQQLIIRTPKGSNKPTKLLHGTSIFEMRLELPEKDGIKLLEGIRIMSLPTALIACPPRHFTAQPIETRSALSMLLDATDLLRRLLSGGNSVVAGRLAGAFRNMDRGDLANNILDTMRAADFTVNESDPFEEKPPIVFNPREISPYVNRLRMTWDNMRQSIIDNFPKAPGLPDNAEDYLKHVDDVYVTDAYHSLSIEGYRVSAELIEKVKSGDWSPDTSKDADHRDALAARGYWQAFQKVKESVIEVLDKNNPGITARKNHGSWYRELFAPSVVAGIIEAADLAGYRNRPVYIRQSMHVPPNVEAIRDLMPTLFELLEHEEHPAVRVVLGHFIFVYIHPYVDGNGRMGRFMMNVMLASAGYPWTIVPVDKRADYMAALEAASVKQDIVPFTSFLAGLVK